MEGGHCTTPRSTFLYSCTLNGEAVVSQLDSCRAFDASAPVAVSPAIEQAVRRDVAKRGVPLVPIQCESIEHRPLPPAAPAAPAAAPAADGTPPEWITKRMASSCGPEFNPNLATAINHFECRYPGTGVDAEGREIRNPYRVWKGRLASCDGSLEVPDALMRDIQAYAYYAAAGHEVGLDPAQFVCDVVTVPPQS